MRILFIVLSVILVGLSSCSSCQRAKEIEERRAALSNHQADELAKAKKELHDADSIASFVQFEVEDLQKQYVFEKNEKYQTRGFWVLPEHKGDKSNLTFFPEVEEEGQMLLVTINSQHKWNFLKIAHGNDKFTSSKEVKDFVGRSLTDVEIAQAQKVYQLSEAMINLRDAQAAKKKNELKVEFYEKKLGKK